MFADIIIPLAVEGFFTYAVPEKWRGTVARGSLVVVPFAGNKRYTGVVYAIHEREPAGFKARSIDRVVEEGFSLSERHLRFLLWMSEYYLSPPGEVIRAALPIAMRLESYTAVTLSGALCDPLLLTEKEQAVMRLLRPGEYLSVSEIEKFLGGQVLSTVKNLLDRSLLTIREEVDELFKPKREQLVRWARDFSGEELHGLLDALKRAPARQACLIRWIDYTLSRGEAEVSRADFFHVTGVGPAILKALCEQGILEVVQREVSRLDEVQGPIEPPYPLSSLQQQAFDRIKEAFGQKDAVLLHGVTASGKTELYIHLIREYLDSGRQVLYLLPEIALTVQIVKRLRRVFGDQIGIYHSGMSDSVRAELWRKQNGPDPYPVILGVRSSVFLPFRKLGLVIVDEEHEASYKQKDPNPRYHGRDAAMMLAALYGARVLLGSATPSFETYRHAVSGKYGLVVLDRRHGEVRMPELVFSDLREYRRKKLMKGSFTPLLYEAIAQTLERGEQVILFQNRRGYATYLQCDRCGDIPHCRRCDVSMTYYKKRNMLNCHYCGSFRPVPERCESCGEGHYREKTPGTERIEEEVREFFPGARVARMDLEAMNHKSKFRALINRFEAGELDVLIGTQMVSKGLDFDRVKLVGVVDADNLLGIPDFRSEERVYQMLMQVSGRSGRKGEQGKVIIQVSDPENRIYQWVGRGDYPAFYEALSSERQLFRYPPYYRLIRIELRHADEAGLRRAANRLAGALRELLGQRVCGPAVPEISRIRAQNRIHILIKAETGLSLSALKQTVRQSVARLGGNEMKGIKVYYDVDPV